MNQSRFLFFTSCLLYLVLSGCGVLPLVESDSADCSDENALLRDGFDDELDCGWVTFSGNDSVERVDGALRISVGTNGVVAWSNPEKSFDDVEVSVLAQQISGPNNNAFGVICRYVDEDNFYIFLISGDGYYAIGKYQSGYSQIQYFTGTDPDYFVPSEAINTGVSSNQLRVRCEGDTLAMHVNGSLLEEVTDGTFSLGDIGLAASVLEPGRVVIEYDNVQVISP